MSELIIKGGKKLYGSVDVQSAKNSVVMLIACAVLSEGKVVLKNVKPLSDVINMCRILNNMGAKCFFCGTDLVLDCSSLYSFVPDENLSQTVRCSFFLTGALLSKFKKAEMTFPGGCKIGTRPINIHLQCLKKLGVTYVLQGNKIILNGEKMRSGVVNLTYPSVGATENLIMASVFLKGETILKNVAKEPEIIDLQNFLNSLGFNVKGAGSDTIVIKGVKKVHSETIVFTPVEDRIEAGTYLLATLACGGYVEINNINIKNIYSLYEKIFENNCKISVENDRIYVTANGGGKSVGKIVTGPYPSFPTDMQAPLCAYACCLSGKTQIRELVFENRFSHVDELKKMGADIYRQNDTIFVSGSSLYGNVVSATDLRAGAGLAIAGLIAQGQTIITNAEMIDRGYYRLEKTLSSLGADIVRSYVRQE